jgi:hypothetical protein
MRQWLRNTEMKLTRPGDGTLTHSDKISLENVAVSFEPIRPTVTQFSPVGMPYNSDEHESFLKIRRVDGIPIKAGFYEFTTMSETYIVENRDEVGWHVLGPISVPAPQP